MTDPSPPPHPTHARPRVSATAIWALVTGLLCIPLLPIILGLAALSRIKASGGRLTGSGLGIAGIVLGLAGIVPLLAALAAPPILRASKAADRTEAANHARHLGIFMFEFENDWGTYPSKQILRENPERFPGVRPGDSSNALLSMLIAGGYTNHENIFYAKGGAARSETTDEVTTPPSRLLEPGECGFGYVMLQGGRAQRTSDNGSRPLLIAPLSPGHGGTDPRFNKNPYKARTISLHIDQSVKTFQIDKRSGQARRPDGTALFENGPGTVWENDVPDVRAPE